MNDNLVGLGAYMAPYVKNEVDRSGGPLVLAGKLVGLGAEEVRAGLPFWAWLGIGFMAGGIAAYAAREQIQRVLK